jgi:DNA-binding XRE family transcriptional regulator
MTVRYVDEKGKRRYAVVPIKQYERMLDDLEMLDDIKTYDEAKAKATEFVPADTAYRILDGENPIRVWRGHRKLTQAALAKRAAISTPYLSQLEAGTRTASTAVLRRLAIALAVDVDDLLEPDASSG